MLKNSKLSIAIQCIMLIIMLVILRMLFPEVNTEENSLLEFLQAGVIALACLSYVYSAMVGKQIDIKVTSIGWALLMFSFLIRELDVEEFPLPDVVRYLLGKEGKDQTMILLWSMYFGVYILYVKDKFQRIKRFFALHEGKLWIIAAILLVFSQAMDKNILHFHHHINRYYEEFLELFSYLYILASSWERVRYRGY